ncbi:unnamed protein product, partial [Dicrocoelium dendriticum]
MPFASDGLHFVFFDLFLTIIRTTTVVLNQAWTSFSSQQLLFCYLFVCLLCAIKILCDDPRHSDIARLTAAPPAFCHHFRLNFRHF